MLNWATGHDAGAGLIVRFNASHQAMISEELYFMQGRDGASVRDPQVPAGPIAFPVRFGLSGVPMGGLFGRRDLLAGVALSP